MDVLVTPPNLYVTTYATDKVFTKPAPAEDVKHRHYFIPALSFDYRLIGVCNDPDCTVTLTAAEIERRMNENE